MAEEPIFKLHDIFKTDPVYLLKLVDSYVRLTLRNKEVIHGYICAIDPVSRSIVLAEEENGRKSIKIILKHFIESVHECSEMHPTENTAEAKKITNVCALKDHEIALKEDIKAWLIKNMIPVIEHDNVLVIDTLQIHPPYNIEQCYCSNPIILSQIQNLLKAMPNATPSGS